MENSQPIPIAKEEKICSRENIKDVTGQLFVKEIRHVTHGSNQLS